MAVPAPSGLSTPLCVTQGFQSPAPFPFFLPPIMYGPQELLYDDSIWQSHDGVAGTTNVPATSRLFGTATGPSQHDCAGSGESVYTIQTTHTYLR